MRAQACTPVPCAEPVDGREPDPWLDYLAFIRGRMHKHNLLFGIQDLRTAIDATRDPALHPVPELRLDPSGTKALP